MKELPDIQYFEQLNAMLQNRDRAVPSLVIDLDILDENIETMLASLSKGVNYRIVVKSLPSIGLLEYIQERTGTKSLMVFHQPFLTEIATSSGGHLDLLLGKPMPVKTVKYFYQSLKSENEFDPYLQVQWLVDTKQRLIQYLNLAQELDCRLKINFEINVGLHRGGFETLSQLSEVLELISSNKKRLEFSGLMGYDPHVVKLPFLLRSRKKALNLANDFYIQCKNYIQNNYSSLWNDGLTLNGAGSPTVELHYSENSPLNDISVGSALVKPTTFDIDTLSGYKPAAFIATPVLKKRNGTTIPGLESVRRLLSSLFTANQQSFFLYGGFWKADYFFPSGIRSNKLFGESTNQTMINAPLTVKLNVDDFVFLRPHQSEYVFLHFGKILAVRNFKVVDEWEVFSNS